MKRISVVRKGVALGWTGVAKVRVSRCGSVLPVGGAQPTSGSELSTLRTSNPGCEPLALSRETGRLALRSTFPAGKEETEVVMQLSRKFPWSPLSRPKPSLPFDFSLGENTTRIPRIGGPPTGSLVRML